ncbi:MAG: hypothetical protein JGK17_13835 [Microcoleus sp. PH2017_10_PVI_O_A]|uniref:hypothetical protein n=1 Tax=unclassified Microcoleus TaxID=2642155 RepID=UPI001D4C4F4E|nr:MULTISPECIES: hypothetical protein [unclassified Microcoleus]MCC3406644.1 hypothetical protein [Microcoleus sp. PH2017_10_PVI_O_A]MCC3460656.1 hypothetical protein [Microcoleus sp. PH2017_11_PCY_U_A]MCC3479203.1 hypothetical protein [Microcoleus sp. PH2017_12_PCY_D_A]MCC3529461.1 hypothetical protein [Microcoleus sp. PH2017_21_RUC_O_A]
MAKFCVERVHSLEEMRKSWMRSRSPAADRKWVKLKTHFLESRWFACKIDAN